MVGIKENHNTERVKLGVLSTLSVEKESQPKVRRQLNNFPYSARRPCSPWVLRPLTSIVLPVYNHADFLAESIESVFSAVSHPFELIIIDDGSTDKTPAVLSSYESHKNVISIRQENQGIAAALNKGFSIANGSFWGWTSADNRYLPQALDHLIDYLVLNPSLAFAYGNVQLIDESGAAFQDSGYRPQDQWGKDRSILQLPLQAESLLSINDNFVNACVLYRADLALHAGDYSTEYLGFEDYDFWMRLSVLASGAHIDLEDPLYQYRLHRNTLTENLGVQTLPQKQDVVRKALLAHHSALASTTSEKFQLSTSNHGQENHGQGNHGRGNLRWGSLLAECMLENGVSLTTVESQDATETLSILSSDSKELLRLREQGLNSPKFRHSSHSAHYSASLNPLQLDVPSLQESTLSRSPVLLPPLSLPNYLRRARDTDYGAVSPTDSSLASVLVFTPELDQDSRERDPNLSLLLRILRECTSVTLAFYCQNALQREVADFINLEVGENDRLRIIDVSDELKQSPEQYSSLLYTLSSVDAVLSSCSVDLNWEKFCELRVEAALAAIAGIPILCMQQSEKDLSEYKDISGCFPIPHLIHASSDWKDKEELHRFFEPILAGSPLVLQHGSLDQWLALQTKAALGRLLKHHTLKAGS